MKNEEEIGRFDSPASVALRDYAEVKDQISQLSGLPAFGVGCSVCIDTGHISIRTSAGGTYAGSRKERINGILHAAIMRAMNTTQFYEMVIATARKRKLYLASSVRDSILADQELRGILAEGIDG